MTEPERKIARALLDEARRARVALEQVNETTPLCRFCGDPIPAERGVDRNGRRKAFPLYCVPLHRKYAWVQTPHGREMQRAAERRRWLRRKQARQTVAA